MVEIFFAAIPARAWAHSTVPQSRSELTEHYLSATFTKLGHVTFKDAGDRSEARELLTVPINMDIGHDDSGAHCFCKLQFHRPYTTLTNRSRQIGLRALDVVGHVGIDPMLGDTRPFAITRLGSTTFLDAIMPKPVSTGNVDTILESLGLPTGEGDGDDCVQEKDGIRPLVSAGSSASPWISSIRKLLGEVRARLRNAIASEDWPLAKHWKTVSLAVVDIEHRVERLDEKMRQNATAENYDGASNTNTELKKQLRHAIILMKRGGKLDADSALLSVVHEMERLVGKVVVSPKQKEAKRLRSTNISDSRTVARMNDLSQKRKAALGREDFATAKRISQLLHRMDSIAKELPLLREEKEVALLSSSWDEATEAAKEIARLESWCDELQEAADDLRNSRDDLCFIPPKVPLLATGESYSVNSLNGDGDGDDATYDAEDVDSSSHPAIVAIQHKCLCIIFALLNTRVVQPQPVGINECGIHRDLCALSPHALKMGAPSGAAPVSELKIRDPGSLFALLYGVPTAQCFYSKSSNLRTVAVRAVEAVLLDLALEKVPSMSFLTTWKGAVSLACEGLLDAKVSVVEASIHLLVTLFSTEEALFRDHLQVRNSSGKDGGENVAPKGRKSRCPTICGNPFSLAIKTIDLPTRAQGLCQVLPCLITVGGRREHGVDSKPALVLEAVVRDAILWFSQTQNFGPTIVSGQIVESARGRTFNNDGSLAAYSRGQIRLLRAVYDTFGLIEAGGIGSVLSFLCGNHGLTSRIKSVRTEALDCVISAYRKLGRVVEQFLTQIPDVERNLLITAFQEVDTEAISTASAGPSKADSLKSAHHPEYDGWYCKCRGSSITDYEWVPWKQRGMNGYASDLSSEEEERRRRRRRRKHLVG